MPRKSTFFAIGPTTNQLTTKCTYDVHVFLFLFRLASAMCTKSNTPALGFKMYKHIIYLQNAFHSQYVVTEQDLPLTSAYQYFGFDSTPRDCESNRLDRRTARSRWRWQIAHVNGRLLSESPKGMDGRIQMHGLWWSWRKVSIHENLKFHGCFEATL